MVTLDTKDFCNCSVAFIAIISSHPLFLNLHNHCQVNVINYMERRTSKDFIELEIIVEKDSQRGILIGKVRFSCTQYSAKAKMFTCHRGVFTVILSTRLS